MNNNFDIVFLFDVSKQSGIAEVGFAAGASVLSFALLLLLGRHGLLMVWVFVLLKGLGLPGIRRVVGDGGIVERGINIFLVVHLATISSDCNNK